MTEHDPLRFIGRNEQLQILPEGNFSFLESQERLTASLCSEFSLATQSTKAFADGTSGVYCHDREGSEVTYRLYINRPEEPIAKSYLSLITSSGLLLGNLTNVDSVLIPRPQERSLQIMSDSEREQFFNSLLLSQQLLEGRHPDEWDPAIHRSLAIKGERWMKASINRGRKVVEILHQTPIDSLIPKLEERLKEDIHLFPNTFLNTP